MLLLYNESVYVRSSEYLAKVAHKEDEEVVFICMLDCVSMGHNLPRVCASYIRSLLISYMWCSKEE